MAVFKRGNVWWYEFVFAGYRVRESSRSPIKSIAQRAERERRRALELGANALEPIAKPLVFAVAARTWLAGNPHWSVNTRRINKDHLNRLLPFLGSRLASEIDAADVQRYQALRIKQGASPASVNLELGTLRQVLRGLGMWGRLQGKVKMLRVRGDVGRALTPDEVERLDQAAAQTRSRSLPVVLTLLRFTGMRISELRLLRWHQVDLPGQHLVVGTAKTKGSEGRMIPLSPTALRTLLDWRSKFPAATPEHYVFPSERYGLDGEDGYKDGAVTVYHIDPTKPITSWKVAWAKAKKTAKIQCRLHDYRHTFISRLAEGQVSDATLMALSGHLTRRMLEHYSHTRVQAKRDAINMLESPTAVPTEG